MTAPGHSNEFRSRVVMVLLERQAARLLIRIENAGDGRSRSSVIPSTFARTGPAMLPAQAMVSKMSTRLFLARETNATP
jgi:hypothetical protein